MRDMGRQTIKRVQDELVYLNNFEAASPEIAEWIAYRAAYKDAFMIIKADVVALTEFEDLIAYIESEWQAYLPIVPGEEPI